jgi:hypothetical protein
MQYHVPDSTGEGIANFCLALIVLLNLQSTVTNQCSRFSASLKCLKRNLVVSSVVKSAIGIVTFSIKR